MIKTIYMTLITSHIWIDEILSIPFLQSQTLITSFTFLHITACHWNLESRRSRSARTYSNIGWNYRRKEVFKKRKKREKVCRRWFKCRKSRSCSHGIVLVSLKNDFLISVSWCDCVNLCGVNGVELLFWCCFINYIYLMVYIVLHYILTLRHLTDCLLWNFHFTVTQCL